MADRQDIDALLVGALYGDLDVADSQRLEAHLASHPQDRAALEAMAHTRGQLREGLAAVPAAEPSPGISAMLLQEAARRAPARKAGGSAGSGLWAWLQGAMRPMAAHPAMAAAAAIVLFAGVASSFLLTGRGRMYEATAPAAQTEIAEGAVATAPTPPLEAPAAAEPAPAPVQAPMQAPMQTPMQTYEAKLDDRQVGDRAAAVAVAPPTDRPRAEPPPPETRAKDEVALRRSADTEARKPSTPPNAAFFDSKSEAASGELAGIDLPTRDADKNAAGKGAAKAPDQKPAKKNERYVRVTTPEPTLKLDEEEDRAGYAAAPDPAPRPLVATGAAPPAAAQAPSGARAGAAPYDAAREQQRTQWARGKHQQLVAAAKRRDCGTASSLAAELLAQAREYFTASVADDRAILNCKAQIQLARKKDAERRNRARADEASKAAAPASQH